MEYEFTLRYQLLKDENVDLLLERLAEAGCDDAVVGIGQPGRLALAFVRESRSAKEAIESALHDVRTAVPWAMQHDPQGFATLFDEQGFFDVRRPHSEGTRVLHLHGGLHLLKLPDGSTRQRSAEAGELLDGFAVNIPGEVPLFVNEERSDEKLRAIRSSDYLTWCLGQLAQQSQGLCLFGQHLDSSDRHLLEAIRQARPAHISIAIRPLSEASVINQKQHFVERFGDMTETTLHFFDASTHPLGAADLAIQVPEAYR